MCLAAEFCEDVLTRTWHAGGLHSKEHINRSVCGQREIMGMEKSQEKTDGNA